MSPSADTVPRAERHRFVAPGRWSVAGQVLAVVLTTALLLVLMGVAAAYWLASSAAHHEASERALGVARTVAAAPTVIQAVGARQPAGLEQYAESVRQATDTDFVVIMTPEGIRYTHPDPAEIGKQFRGHIEAAVRGGIVLEDYTGTLGPSVRAVVPIRRSGAVIGLVSVGISESAASARVREQLPAIALGGGAFGVLAGIAAWVLARRVRSQTRGLDAAALQDMYDYHDAVLHAVTEGLVIVSREGRLRVCNDRAQELLRLSPSAIGSPIAELGLPAPLIAALTDESGRRDEMFVTADRVLVLNQAPAQWQGHALGHVTTLRDRTELESLTGELDLAHGLTEALRSQAHESANRLHTVVSLIEMGQVDEALDFATEELQVSQQLTDQVVASVEEPVLSALLLGKAAEAAERGVTLIVAPEAHVPPGLAPHRDLVTIVGNLLDNALDAVADAELPSRRVGFDATVDGDHAVLEVWDTGRGLPEGAQKSVFERGWSTKSEGSAGRRGIGLALVIQTVHRLGGEVEVDGPPGARFTVTLPVESMQPAPSAGWS